MISTRMNTRHIAILFCLLGLVLTSSVIAQQNDIPEELNFRVPPEEFPIFPWDSLRPSKAAYQELQECGFNLGGFAQPKDLSIVAAAGMKCFVVDPAMHDRIYQNLPEDQITAQVKQLIAATSKSPAVFGYHVIDEPPASKVPQVVRWVKAFEAAAPQTLIHVNLLPIGGEKNAEANYEKYLDSYIQQAKPKAFSFDHYSIMADGTVRANYFQCLEVARRVSIKTGVPFWQICQAIAHFHYALPSPATLRFQAYTSLAYGARGIGWFTYSGRDRGNYRASAIDLFGHRTPTWDMLREINLQLQRLAPIYTKLKSVGVFHHPQVPLGCQGIADSHFLRDVRGQGPFVVGEFEDAAGRPAVLVVNCNLQRSTTFSIVAKTKAKILRVSSFTGKIRPWGAEDNWLAPGQGILLILDKE